jgi:hypothetical protein
MRVHRAGIPAGVIVALLLGGCLAQPTPSSSPSPTPSPSVSAPGTATPEPSRTPGSTQTVAPTATPEPPLSLDLPAEVDDRAVRVAVASDVPADADGTITVTVESLADTMITELVLRWPEELHATLFPAPFQPTAERIRDGGLPLRQQWTKWVLGPGERGEPAGTVSLGYGPLPAGGTLEIPLYVTRRSDGTVAFDLQVLDGEALLVLDDGAPAELRVEVS